MELNLNGRQFPVPDAWRDDTLLAVVRETAGLVGTRYGCGVGVCGACTVLIDGEPMRACTMAVASAVGRRITTIEGLSRVGLLHPVQAAWEALDVPQCGYCQTGQILCAVALLSRDPDPDDAAIDDAMAGQLCRCGTYPRIRIAIRQAVTGR